MFVAEDLSAEFKQHEVEVDVISLYILESRACGQLSVTQEITIKLLRNAYSLLM